MRELLVEHGTLNAQERLWHGWQRVRSLRLAQVDLRLHLKRLDEETALAMLRELESTSASAVRLLVTIARHPTDHLGAVLGWRMLHRLWALLVESGQMSLGELNDRVLGSGSAPPALLIPHLFGDEIAHRVTREFV